MGCGTRKNKRDVWNRWLPLGLEKGNDLHPESTCNQLYTVLRKGHAGTAQIHGPIPNIQGNPIKTSSSFLTAALLILLISGCASMSPQTEKSAEATSTTSQAAQDSTSKKAGATVADQEGVKVTGINGKTGEIIGKPVGKSKFTALQMGMGVKQVTDIVGPPTDQGAYVTGKAFIPFYFGDDKHRFEMAYKGLGRLIFAGESFGSGAYLIKIIHNAKDTGYRS